MYRPYHHCYYKSNHPAVVVVDIVVGKVAVGTIVVVVVVVVVGIVGVDSVVVVVGIESVLK